MKKILPWAVMSILFCCCESSEKKKAVNKFSDEVILKIADLRDRRLPDSLFRYFGDTNALYRKEAVLSFASIQDSSAVDRIGRLLLMDPDADVRKAAAFAMGQRNHSKSERLILGALMKEKEPGVVFELLQAYGKTTKKWNLDNPALRGDSLRSEGLAWSLYRAGLRGKTDSVANRIGQELLDQKYTRGTRLGAAHFFSRGASNYESASEALQRTAISDPEPDVRMAATLSLGKIKTDASLTALRDILRNEKDPRVIVQAVRAMGSFPFNDIKSYLYETLAHNDINVSIAASEVLIATITPDAWIEVSTITSQLKAWRVQANVYEATLKAGRRDDIAGEIKQRVTAAADPYQRATFMGALKVYPPAWKFVLDELHRADTPVVRSVAASTLVAMNSAKEFPASLRDQFSKTFSALLRTNDPAVVGIVAGALADPVLDYKKTFSDLAALKEAKAKLVLPEDNEAIQAVDAAIAHLEGREVSVVENKFNHPIDWAVVKEIPEDQQVVIKTQRGSIVIRLFVNEAPGSVANFVTLAQNHYFDNLFFHRVVPNFVVQGGCPRGDGWGGEDYSIRSEFSGRRYKTGSVGMASAGKDTEGTQWFITHSPTPHLDGRYTVFGEVVEGMDAVQNMEVGDKIFTVVLEK